MQYRTDLALECKEGLKTEPKGVKCKEYSEGEAKITEIDIIDSDGEKALHKPIGKYITIEMPAFSDNIQNDNLVLTVSKRIKNFIEKDGTVMVVGLGNSEITPDALGPETAAGVLATRHIINELKRVTGEENINSVSVITTGVLGQTGVESFEIIKGIFDRIKPSAVIVVDALASRNTYRLGCTVQMSDSGIEPGAGVGNARKEISEKTLGAKVITIGVPTVVEADVLAENLTGEKAQSASPHGRKMIVTPREIDLIIKRASRFVASCINMAVNPGIKKDILNEMLE